MTCCVGIDEAGYGPILGPLVVTAVAINGANHTAVDAALRASSLNIRDSKALHKSGDLRPLERVALAGISWLTGMTPTTAEELFALLGELPDARDLPWMAGADNLLLPSSDIIVDQWQVSDCQPIGVNGSIIHPRELNDARTHNHNRAAVELDSVLTLLDHWGTADGLDALVDRLGGRRYYRDGLTRICNSDAIEILSEDNLASSYAWGQAHSGKNNQVSFAVKADASSMLVALASCIAKYTRELHMQLFNTYWAQRYPWLKPTAGYAKDAKRWLFQIGSGLSEAWRNDLVRS